MTQQPDNTFEEDKVEVDSYHQQHYEQQRAQDVLYDNVENTPEVPPNMEQEAQAVFGEKLLLRKKFARVINVIIRLMN